MEIFQNKHVSNGNLILNNGARKDHVLVTGGAGYIGMTLVQLLLSEGHIVTIYDNFTWGALCLIHLADHPNLHIVDGDILDRENLGRAMADVDAVVHLAAIAGYPACDRDPQKARDVNIIGTKNVCDLLKAHQKVIYSSTGSCYGKVDGVCTEETPIHPLTLYGITKAEGEVFVKKSGGVILRLATLFGLSPKMRFDLLLNTFALTALSSPYLDIFEGNFRRTFLHVKDAARAFMMAVDKYDIMKGDVYNVGDEKMNMTKLAGAKIVKSRVITCEITSSTGEDPDKRDYAVSYDKIRKLGFKSTISVLKGVNDMVTVISKLSTAEIDMCKSGRNHYH